MAIKTLAISGSARLAIALSLAAAPVTAAQVNPTRYDMPNGGGTASGGSYNYWDRSYSGAGATTTDGAALSGGKGDLTDGVVAAGPWYAVESGGGTGPYVGWYDISLTSPQHNPVVTFHFAGGPTITSINIHMDHSFVGGVQAPQSILVDGVDTAFVPPGGGFGWTTLSGFNLTGNTHTLQFNQVPGYWVFVSEVNFQGIAGGVPEPAAWAMLLLGFGFVGSTMRSRRRNAVAA